MPHLGTPCLSLTAPLKQSRGGRDRSVVGVRETESRDRRAGQMGQVRSWGGVEDGETRKGVGTTDLTAPLPLEFGHMVLIRT